MSEFWNALSAISAAVAAVVVVVAGIYAKGQVAEAKRTREVALLTQIYERYSRDDVRSLRRRQIHGEFDNVDRLSTADYDALSRNLDQLEFLAIAVEHGLLDFNLVKAVFLDSPPRVWAMAQKYHAWARTPSDPGPASHLARLAARYDPPNRRYPSIAADPDPVVPAVAPGPAEAG